MKRGRFLLTGISHLDVAGTDPGLQCRRIACELWTKKATVTLCSMYTERQWLFRFFPIVTGRISVSPSACRNWSQLTKTHLGLQRFSWGVSPEQRHAQPVPAGQRLSSHSGELALGKHYLVKHLRRNISPMMTNAPNSSVLGSGTVVEALTGGSKLSP